LISDLQLFTYNINDFKLISGVKLFIAQQRDFLFLLTLSFKILPIIRTQVSLHLNETD